MTSDPPRRPRPTFQDWLLLAINVVFVAMGLVILPSKPDVGVVTLAFFGSCLVVTAGSVWRKLRDRRFSADTVEVVGGVPIRPRVGLFSLAGLWMLALGTVLIVFGHAYPLLFRIKGPYYPDEQGDQEKSAGRQDKHAVWHIPATVVESLKDFEAEELARTEQLTNGANRDQDCAVTQTVTNSIE